MTTTNENIIHDSLDPSSAILLVEHERISSLYQLNTEMGDKFVGIYLTVVSVIIALIVALGQFGLSSDSLFPVEGALLVMLLAIGTITFMRLVERRARGAEYLRAINRIHCYFANKDPNIKEYLFWPPHDDTPPIKGKGHTLSGLRSIVAMANSLVFGLAAGMVMKSLTPSLNYSILLLIGLVISLGAWFAHDKIEEKALRSIELELNKNVKYRQLSD